MDKVWMNSGGGEGKPDPPYPHPHPTPQLLDFTLNLGEESLGRG